MNREQLQKAIYNFEMDPDDYQDQFDALLDEQGDIQIGNLSYRPSLVLREVDPIAYRAGLLDYVGMLDNEDDPKYHELLEQLEEMGEE
jgi:hypothetical protein